jgi:hypothetical protein
VGPPEPPPPRSATAPMRAKSHQYSRAADQSKRQPSRWAYCSATRNIPSGVVWSFAGESSNFASISRERLADSRSGMAGQQYLSIAGPLERSTAAFEVDDERSLVRQRRRWESGYTATLIAAEPQRRAAECVGSPSLSPQNGPCKVVHIAPPWNRVTPGGAFAPRDSRRGRNPSPPAEGGRTSLALQSARCREPRSDCDPRQGRRGQP